MTETGAFATDRSALLACADVLAGYARWDDAARFAGRALTADDPDHAMRVEVIWWLLLAGRAKDAAARLVTLPDTAHPEMVALRFAAAGLSEPERAPAMLRSLLTELGSRPPSATGLRLVAMLARAAGDEETAVRAAERYVATIEPRDTELASLLAVDRALRGNQDPQFDEIGELTEAAMYTERAASGRIGARTAAIREVADEVAERGGPVLAARLLAEGFLYYRRDEYAELMLPLLPRRVRWRNQLVGFAVAALVLGVGFAVTRFGTLFPIGLALMPLGALLALWAAFGGVRGLSRRRANKLTTAYGRFRTRRGLLEVPATLAGAAAAGFTVAVMLATGKRTGPLPLPALLVAAGVGLLAVAIAAMAVVLHRRRTAARLAAADEPFAAEPCRCWETDALVGGQWRDYLGDHLEAAATEPTLDAALRRCRKTGKTWLHLAAAELAFAVRFPAEPLPYSDGYL